jgi:hypothetical protein
MSSQFVEYNVHVAFLAVEENLTVLQCGSLKNMFVVKYLVGSDFPEVVGGSTTRTRVFEIVVRLS